LFCRQVLPTRGKCSFADITRLQELDVMIVKALDAERKTVDYPAIYSGEAVASGTAKKVRDALKEIWEARGAALLELMYPTLTLALMKWSGRKREWPGWYLG
jgi:hypothetical protein